MSQTTMTGLTLLALAATLCFADAYKISRIMGGSATTIEAHPWQLSLRNPSSHICGATLVSPGYAVTAAHCVEGGSSFTIGYGHADKREHKSVAVTNVVMHPSYDGSAAPYPNDIAVLKLASSIPTSSTANSIAMATSADLDWNSCYISGWGANGWLIPGIFPTTPNILQHVAIPKISYADCNSRWSNIELPTTNVCVMDPNQSASACSGDSGGPLICSQNGVDVLVGATSWGSSSCAGNYPSVYTRISSFRSWILGQMA